MPERIVISNPNKTIDPTAQITPMITVVIENTSALIDLKNTSKIIEATISARIMNI
ncbi:hypothetical protein SDC9_87805 [bioreactor metagenome]|uniref:Uncharacterized protein n=1 Tax=bioreactor metagenome TaxID=1076179 RepID=A0A644ZJT5_9ZZZZ